MCVDSLIIGESVDILMCCSMSRRNERERKEGRKERKKGEYKGSYWSWERRNKFRLWVRGGFDGVWTNMFV